MLKGRKFCSLLLTALLLLQLVPVGIKLIPEGKSFAEVPAPSAVPQVVNLLGSAGDCDSLTEWTATNGSTVLNKSQKVFGSASIKFNATNGNGYVSRDISSTLVKDEKYYLVSVYLRNCSIDNAYNLEIMDLVGSSYTSLCKTPSQMAGAFKRVGVKLSADDISDSSIKRELRINVVQNSQTEGQYGLFDGIMINAITEEEYLDESVDSLLGKYPFSGGTKYPTYPIEIGTNTAFVVCEDGTVKAWGVNTNGQLGLGNLDNQPVPTTMPVLNDVRSVASGENHGMAIINDGTVKAWGKNTYGQLGINSTTDTTTSVDISGLDGVKQIAAGQFHSIALMEDGTVKAWGRNNYGQLGLGDNTDRLTPVTIPGIAGVKQIAAGYNSSYAVMNDGTVKTWGYNGHGRLGLGDYEDRKTPVTIPDLLDVWYIEAGGFHVFAHTADGNIKAWGKNDYGQLGLGDNIGRNKPELVEISGVKRIVAGVDFTVARMNNGTVKTWGYNINGQLGLGNNKNQVYPQTIPEIDDVKYIDAGGAYTFAVLNDGTMKYWGSKIGNTGSVNIPTEITISGMRTNSSPVMGINYPSSYTEVGVRASVLGADGNCESTTGWIGSNAAAALDTSAKLFGSNAIKGTLSASSTGYVYRDVKSLFDTSRYYFITAYVRSGSTNSVNLYCNFGTAKNATANATTTYARQGIKIQPSDMGSATEYQVGLRLNAATASQYGFIDNLIIIEITADEYAKLTESQLMAKYTYNNLLEGDGDCEELGAWNAKTGTSTLDTTNKAIGDNSIKLVGNSGTDTGVEKYITQLNTSKYYLLSGYGKSASGGNLNMLIGSTYGSATNGGSTGAFTASTFVRKGFAFKPTSSNVLLSLVASAIPGQQHTAYFDGIMLKEISQNEFNTLTVEQLMERYPYEGNKTEFAANNMIPATLKMKSGDNNVVISVSDAENDVLTCSLYVDDESVARDTKVVSNSWQEQDVNLALGSLADGDHLIKVEVWDGKETVQYSVNAYTMQRIKSIVPIGSGAFVVMEDGSVKTWGSNSYGELGLGDTQDRYISTTIPELSSVKKIVTSSGSTYAIMNDGTVKAWGRNYNGQLGLGFIGDVYSPTLVEGLTNVRDIFTDGSSNFAILTDGSVMVWGRNDNGNLGLGDGTFKYTPVRNNNISNVDNIYTYSAYYYAVIKEKLYCWGYNANWVLGVNTGSSIVNKPTLCRSDVKKFISSGSRSYVISTDGYVYGWGYNGDGCIGDGSTTTYIASAVKIPNISNAKELFGTSNCMFVKCENGDVWTWGYNYYGQLGLGDTVERKTPNKVNEFYGVKKIITGNSTIAVFSDYYKAVGSNAYGQLGVGHKNTVAQPQIVSLSKNVGDICGSNNNFFVTFNDNSIKCWGQGLGLGENVEKLTPYDYCSIGTAFPKILRTFPTSNQVINVLGESLFSSITVFDGDNDELEIKAYLDSSETYFNSKVIKNTINSQTVNLNLSNLPSISEGTHTMKFDVSDGFVTTSLSVDFIYDISPVNSDLKITTTDNSISVNASATDNRGLDILPYRFSIDSVTSGWLEAAESTRFSKIDSYSSANMQLVKIDVGYVASAFGSSKINFYRTIDNGLTWTNIGYINSPNSSMHSITSKGNMIYCSYMQYNVGAGYDIRVVSFDSSTRSSATEITGSVKVFNDNCSYKKPSISVDANNKIHIAFSSWDTTMYYTKSSDGLVWDTPTLFPPTSGYNAFYPVINMSSSGQPYIIYLYSKNDQYQSGGYKYTYMVRSLLFNGTSWVNSIIYNGKEFAQSSPAAFIDKNNKTHVVWLAYDKTDSTKYNVFYSKSDDGSNWTQPTKITKGNVYNCETPTIYVDSLNRVYIEWVRNGEIEKVTFKGKWSEVEKLGKGLKCDKPSFCINTRDLTQPVMVYRDTASNDIRFAELRSGGTSYTFNSLLPGTKYTVKFETKDTSGNVEISTKDVYTSSGVPSLTIGTKSATTANITITDSNGSSTKYKVKVGDKFLQPDGTLSTKSDLITTKSIKIKGLKPNTTYQLYIKAVNGENIETRYSSAVSLITANTVPEVPTNIKASSYGTNVKVSWDEQVDAQSYDVEIDSVVYSGATSTSYIRIGLSAGVSHNVRVRGVNTAGAGAWSSIYTTTIVASKTNQILVNYSVGKIFNIVLSAGSLKDVDICTFKLTYDPAKLEVLDLCADTIDKELATGDIADTGIKVIEFNPTTGLVRYTVAKSANDGSAWTGALNSVKFRSKSANPSTITYILE